jgi:hypothetical protein
MCTVVRWIKEEGNRVSGLRSDDQLYVNQIMRIVQDRLTQKSARSSRAKSGHSRQCPHGQRADLFPYFF